MSENTGLIFLIIMLTTFFVIPTITITSYLAYKEHLKFKREEMAKSYENTKQLYYFLKEMKENDKNGDIFITIINHKKIKKGNIHKYTSESIMNGTIEDIYTTRKDK